MSRKAIWDDYARICQPVCGKSKAKFGNHRTNAGMCAMASKTTTLTAKNGSTSCHAFDLYLSEVTANVEQDSDRRRQQAEH